MNSRELCLRNRKMGDAAAMLTWVQTQGVLVVAAEASHGA